MRQTLLLTLVVTSALLVGCGNDSGGGAAGVISGSGVAGTYVLDAEDMLEKMQKMMMEQMGDMVKQMPPEQLEEMKKEMAKNAQSMNVEMSVKADNTWTGTAKMGGDKKETSSGTWSKSGDTITFTLTHEDGKEKDEPESIKGVLVDGGIKLKPEKDMPFDIVLRRK
jgi:hypothetical protein